MAKRHKSVFTPCRSRVSAPGPARMCTVGLSRWLPRQNQEAGQLQARTSRTRGGAGPAARLHQPQVDGKYLWPPGEIWRLACSVFRFYQPWHGAPGTHGSQRLGLRGRSFALWYPLLMQYVTPLTPSISNSYSSADSSRAWPFMPLVSVLGSQKRQV